MLLYVDIFLHIHHRIKIRSCFGNQTWQLTPCACFSPHGDFECWARATEHRSWYCIKLAQIDVWRLKIHTDSPLLQQHKNKQTNFKPFRNTTKDFLLITKWFWTFRHPNQLKDVISSMVTYKTWESTRMSTWWELAYKRSWRFWLIYWPYSTTYFQSDVQYRK